VKSICFVLLIFIGIISVFLIFGEKSRFSKNPMAALSAIVNQGNVDELTLTIFYMSPAIMTGTPVSVASLMREYDNLGGKKIVIEGSELKEHIDLFERMSNTEPISVDGEFRIDARIYYVFRSKSGRRVLDIAMWGYQDKASTIIMNGIGVEENDIYYEIIAPFLIEEEARFFIQHVLN